MEITREVKNNPKRFLGRARPFCPVFPWDGSRFVSSGASVPSTGVQVLKWKRLMLLDGQNRQSPIASDCGSRTQIAALFAVLLCIGVFKTNRQSRVSNHNFKSQGRQRFESRVFKSLAILDLDRAI